MSFCLSTETIAVPALEQALQLVWVETPAGYRFGFSNLGAGFWSAQMPSFDGNSKVELLQNYQNLADFAHNPYFLAVCIGRVANRIRQARYPSDAGFVELSANEGSKQLHGGPQGFGSRFWQCSTQVLEEAVVVGYRLHSPEGDQGYPGAVDVTVQYKVLATEVQLCFSAVSNMDTPVSLTNHAYWTLSGIGGQSILNQQLWLAASYYLVLDNEQLPTGEVRAVSDVMDFRLSKTIGQDLGLLPGGYDHYFVLDSGRNPELPAAVVRDPKSGRTLQLYTDQPGIQFYSGNFLDGRLRGQNGEFIQQYAALCLEPHGYPDAPNRPEFPSVLLRAGETYQHVTRFCLGYS
ncbi:aldose epimerase family protein [Rheinheimera sp.]|uniref:aldose epimerase family protein n=1 Tax=Rheinheimera sp. TaxID=1869214 RepID=UPI00307EBCC4